MRKLIKMFFWNFEEKSIREANRITLKTNWNKNKKIQRQECLKYEELKIHKKESPSGPQV